MKSSLLEKIVSVETTERIEGVRVGKVVNVDESGRIWVKFPGNGQGPVAARFTRSVKLQALRDAASSGQEVLLVFENNSPRQPIIIDTMFSLLDEVTASPSFALEREELEHVMVDGKKVILDAQEEIVLCCGKASITLTQAGKVIIRGSYVLSRSSGVNKVKGGSIELN